MNNQAPAGRPANAPSPRRLLITVAIFSIVAGIVAIIVMGQQRGAGTTTEQATAAAPATTPAGGVDASAAAATSTNAATAAEAPPTAGAAPTTAPPPAAPSSPWVAKSPGSPSTTATPLGSLDPAKGKFLVELTPRGAGISRVVFSDLWKSGTDRTRAAEARAAGTAEDALEGRYEIAAPGTLQGFTMPILAARAIEVDGREVSVVGQVWVETAPGTFVTEIADSTGALQMRATRRWSVEPGSWEIRCEQRVENLSASPHSVRWVQFGPSDLPRDPTDLVDARRYHSGYLMSKERDPAQSTVIVHGATLDQSTVVSRVDSGDWRVWPDARQQEERYKLSWFGATNRYFALAIHAPYAPPGSPSKAIAPAAAVVQAQVGEGTFHGKPDRVVFTDVTSDAVTVAPGQSAAFDVGVFAGPLERSLLGAAQPFASLNMQGLILYLMSGCCSWCTFAWLADILVSFLAFLHDWVVFDWGLAIIVLVVVVRGLLHPLTRRAQVSMMRVSKQMGSLKPEIDALQKRYRDDQKKLQEETMRLYREKGINPLGCAGGMLPTFLQMPIWLALYAVLYFAFELRQQPAFFGVFQQIGGWQFLGDLSAQDRFIPLPFEVNIWVTTLSSVNIVPILMGVVFYFQQKYMTPPPAPNATPEQLQQQAMMKWMMVILFPIMLYAAPSGLTIYIATSTLVGIYESKRIRKSMEGVDFSKAPARKPGGFMQRAYETAMKRAQEAQRSAEARRGAPSRKFRDR
jgi:YidC/Oxa1 family membrane protein insertase